MPYVTEVSRVTWAFTNVSKDASFWPRLDSIDITDGHPIDQSTFACQVEDAASAFDFDEDDIIRVTQDDGSGVVKIHEGPLQVVAWTDHGRSGPRVWDLTATDYTPTLGWDVITSSGTRRKETGTARLAWLMTFHTHGITVASQAGLTGDVDSADFLGQSVLDAIEQLCQDLNLSYFVDFDQGLHIFSTLTVSAPFGICASGADNVDWFPFWDWKHERDVTEQATKALVVGDKRYALIADAGAVTAYGVKEETVEDSSLKSVAALARAGARALLNDAYPAISGDATIMVYGLRAGMTLPVKHNLWPGVTAGSPYIVTEIHTEAVDAHDDNSQAALRTQVKYSDRRRHKAKGRGGGGGDHGGGDESGSALGVTMREYDYERDEYGPSVLYSESYGNPTVKHIGSELYHNIPYTSTDCGIGGGGYSGRNVREAWYELTLGALSDDVVGVRFTIPIAAVPNNGGIYAVAPYEFGWAWVEPTGLEQYAVLQALDWIASGAVVDLPRYACNEAGITYVTIAPAWRSRDGFACGYETGDEYHGPTGPTGNGLGNSGMVVAPTITAKLLTAASGRGLMPWMSGIGAVDGSNRTFTLPGWDGSGVPQVKVNGLVLDSGDYTVDEDAGTITLRVAPEAGDVPTFRWKAST